MLATILLLAATALSAPICESPASRSAANIDLGDRDVAETSPISPPPFRYIHPKLAPTKCVTGVQGVKGYEGTVLTM